MVTPLRKTGQMKKDQSRLSSDGPRNLNRAATKLYGLI